MRYRPESSRTGRPRFALWVRSNDIFPSGKQRDRGDDGKGIRASDRAGRRALGMTQRDLALVINTGERFVVDLEAGKATSQLGKALAVGIRLLPPPAGTFGRAGWDFPRSNAIDTKP